MSNSNNNVLTLQTGQIAIAPGATLAVKFTQLAESVAVTMKYMSGGTLEILGITAGPGASFTAADLASLNGTGYMVDTTEVLNFGGPTAFYLSATGATVVVHYMRGMNK